MTTPAQPSSVAYAIQRYGGSAGFLIPILQDIQREYGYLPQPQLRELSRQLGVPLSRVYNVATFYKSFSLQPRGRHLINVCTGTVCHLKGASRLVEAIRQQLKLPTGETTADMRFSLNTVNCVGACALAPVIVVDGAYYAKTKPGEVSDILKANK
jgi:NADH-quinone oxidoreductase subunit E